MWFYFKVNWFVGFFSGRNLDIWEKLKHYNSVKYQTFLAENLNILMEMKKQK